MIVEHGADLAVHRADHEEVADVQRAVLYQQRRHRTAALVDSRFKDGAASLSIGIGFQLTHIGDQQNHFQQLVDILFGLGGDFHHYRVAAPFFGHQSAVGQLALDALGIGVGLVDFIESDDDRNFGGTRVIDGFLGLRHHTVVRTNHQHYDVGYFCAACAHAGKGFVTRGVDEDDALRPGVRFVCPDVLGDASGFAASHVGGADRVQQAGLPVVHMPHHSDYWRARYGVSGGVFLLLFFLNQLLFKADRAHYAVKRFRQRGGRGHVQRLVDAGEDAAVEQGFQQILGANVQLFGQLANRDSFGNRNVARLALNRRRGRLGHRRPARTSAGTRPNGMELALSFGESLFDERASASRGGRLARVQRFSGFCFRAWCARRARALRADWSLLTRPRWHSRTSTRSTRPRRVTRGGRRSRTAGRRAGGS